MEVSEKLEKSEVYNKIETRRKAISPNEWGTKRICLFFR